MFEGTFCICFVQYLRCIAHSQSDNLNEILFDLVEFREEAPRCNTQR